MQKKIYLIVAVLITIIIVAAWAGLYLASPGSPQENGKISVVVTVLPYKDFVEQVGGNRIGNVTDIVPIQAGCGHDYEMTPKQMKAVSGAQLYVAVGAGHEFEEANLEKIQAQNPDMSIVDTSVGISLLTITGVKRLARLIRMCGLHLRT